MNAVDLEQLVLRHIRRDDYRPVKPRVMAQQLGLPKHQHAELKKVVKQLAKTGQLSYAANHLVQPARDRAVTKSWGHSVAICPATASSARWEREVRRSR